MDYEIYQLECPICNGVLKVDRFLRNDFAYRFNVYKCIDCGEETQDMYPINMNMYWRFFKVTDDFFFKLFADKNVKEVDKTTFRIQYKTYEKGKKEAIKTSEDFEVKKEAQRKHLLVAIDGNNTLYNAL